MMFEQGSILYFKPFYFENGTYKNKFFLVLKNLENETLLVSLPTSKGHIPDDYFLRNGGCVNIFEKMLSCYIISPNTPVTTCGKYFEVYTYLYGGLLKVYDLKEITDKYNFVTNYTYWGMMKKELFLDILECFKRSKMVKSYYKKRFLY